MTPACSSLRWLFIPCVVACKGNWQLGGWSYSHSSGNKGHSGTKRGYTGGDGQGGGAWKRAA